MAAPVYQNTFSDMTTKCLISLRENGYSAAKFNEVDEVEYKLFFENYLLPNMPCMFGPGVTEMWKSRDQWVESNAPNFRHLKSKFGEATVPVADCKREQFSSHPKQDMLMKDFLDYWEEYRACSHPGDKPCLYLKDWHCAKAFPDYNAYKTPVYFQSDWLNEFWDTLPQDDYRFVYMGPKGSWTPFHSDVYRSYSWSANICGKKKWTFYPPGCEENLKDTFGNLIYDITILDNDPESYKKFPKAEMVKGQRLEVIQGQGQIIFVPSGWHHQVINLEDTISINHNWLNGCNIDLCWKHLRDSLSEVKREIADCRAMDDWEKQCQLVLNASAGLDYKIFIQMLRVIAVNRLKQLNKSDKSVGIDMTEGMERNNSCESNEVLVTDKCTNAKGEDSCEKIMGENLNGVDAKDILPADKSTKDSLCNDCRREHKEIDDCDNLCCCLQKTQKEETGIHCLAAEWYTRFDLMRIEDVLNEVISDDDYKALHLDYLESAEYVVELINDSK